ncbi:MAG: hypothetical protein AABW73_01385 [Nanoarchaeota archaeon]
MKKGLIFVPIIIFVFVVIIFILNHNPPSDTNPEGYGNRSVNDSFFGQSLADDCDIMFSEYFIDPVYVQKVGQIGVVHGFGKSIVERSYVSIKEEFKNQKIPIYAPTDMILVSGSRYKMPGASEGYIPDYVLKFELGCDVELVFGHLKDVVPQISEQIYELRDDSREINIRPVKFKAGDLIAYYIPQDGGVAGFDFIVRDRKISNKFLNQARYDAGFSYNLRSGVCPYDFYSGEKKVAYYELFGGGGGTLFKVKSCGFASRDVPGSISGMWFLDKEVKGSIYDYYSDGDYGSPISIVGDEERVAIGNLGSKSPVNYFSSNNPSYKLPDEVTVQHCFQILDNFNSNSANGFIFFKVIDNMTIDVYYSANGSCPATMPASSRRYYK